MIFHAEDTRLLSCEWEWYGREAGIVAEVETGPRKGKKRRRKRDGERHFMGTGWVLAWAWHSNSG